MTNSIRRAAYALCLPLLLAMPGEARAQTVLFDVAFWGGNAAPFGTALWDAGHRYQQIYRGSAFGTETVFLSSLTLFDETPLGVFDMNGGTFRFTLSTTHVDPGTISSDYAGNTGGDARVVFEQAIVGGADIGTGEGAYTFTFDEAFAFDPTAGNLLWDVQILSTNHQGWYLFGAGRSDDIARAGTYENGTFAQSGYGLRTEFGLTEGAPQTVVPEPISMVLLGSGLVGVAGAARRRRRERIEA